MHPVVRAGIVVTVADICAAFVVRYAFMKATPVRVLQGIASGMMGPAAFRGGLTTALIGFVLHCVIAFAVAGVYFAASRKLRVLVVHPVWAGAGYGVIVHSVMNYVVLPLSRFPVGPRAPSAAFRITMIMVHVFFVGLPVAVIVSGWRPARKVPLSRLRSV